MSEGTQEPDSDEEGNEKWKWKWKWGGGDRDGDGLERWSWRTRRLAADAGWKQPLSGWKHNFNSILRHFSLTFPAKRVVVIIIDVKRTPCPGSQSLSPCVCVCASLMRVLGQFLRNIIKSCCEVPIGSNCWNQSAFSPFPFLQPGKQCEINMLYTPRFIVCTYIYFNGGIWLFCSLRFPPASPSSSLSHSSLIHFIDCMRFFVMLQTSAKQLTNSNMPQKSVSLFSRSLSLTISRLFFVPALFLSFIVVRRMQSISAREAKSVAYFCALSTGWVVQAALK